MNILIVFDSFFGNTENVAEGMAAALRSKHHVIVLRACKASTHAVAESGAVIVGSPTRAFRPSEATMEFLKFLPENSLAGKIVAAFDTRISKDDIGSTFFQFLVNLGGYAAKPIAKWLQKKGALTPVPTEGFYVNGKEGPLKDGELDKAAEWAKHLIG